MAESAQNAADHRQLLEQLLNEHKAADYQLPPLSADFSSWQQYIEELKQAIRAYLHSLDSPISADFRPWMEQIALGVMYVILLGILLGILVWLARVLLSLLSGKETGPPRSETLTGIRADLLKDLSRATQEGRWALALRLRWKLFLLACRLAAHLTPREFAARREPQPWIRRPEFPADSLEQLYRIMFGAGSSDSGAYREFDELFSSWEDAAVRAQESAVQTQESGA